MDVKLVIQMFKEIKAGMMKDQDHVEKRQDAVIQQNFELCEQLIECTKKNEVLTGVVSHLSGVINSLDQ